MLSMTTRTPAPSRRVRTAGAAAGLLCALLLGACSGQDADEPGPAPSGPGTTTPDAGGTPDPDAPLTVREACVRMYVEGEDPLEGRVVAALVGISEGADTDSVRAMTAVGIELGSLSARAPEELAGAVDKVRVPFLQLQENLDTGTEESVDLDIASAREGLTELRAACEDAGEAAGA
jgi:hypothetical protein